MRSDAIALTSSAQSAEARNLMARRWLRSSSSSSLMMLMSLGREYEILSLLTIWVKKLSNVDMVALPKLLRVSSGRLSFASTRRE